MRAETLYWVVSKIKMDHTSSKDTLARISLDKRAELERRLLSKLVHAPQIDRIPNARSTGPYPLSLGQQSLFFLYHLYPESPAYNEPKALRITGTLDVAVLKDVLNTILDRHEILRTTFSVYNSVPSAIPRDSRSVELAVFDLNNGSEEQVTRLIHEITCRPFDLAKDLMLRTALIRTNSREHILLLVTHHIVSDASTRDVLFREIAVLYDAFSKGIASPLPPLRIQYRDFVFWQRQRATAEMLDEQLSYWKNQLSSVPSVLNLPIDYPRTASQTFRGGSESLVLSKALTQGLIALSNHNRVTLFMTLLSGLQLLLWRYSGQERFLIGSPFFGRQHKDLEDLVGYFVSPVLLSADLRGNPCFEDSLSRTRDMAMGAYAHPDIPFERLFKEISIERSLTFHSMFQVMFNLRTLHPQPTQTSDLIFAPIRTKSGTSKFDLSLVVDSRPGELKTTLTYNVDLFSPATIRRLLASFDHLLQAIVNHPRQRISDYPILTKADKRQLLVDWNTAGASYPIHICVHELFEAQARKTPDARAIVFQSETLTYRQLNRQANQLARRLRSLGVRPGAFVGLCVERSLEMVVGILAILKAGGAYVPLDPEYPKERLAFMLEDAQAGLLLTQTTVSEKLLQDREFSSLFLHRQMAVICLDVELNRITGELTEDFTEKIDAQNVACVLYTSGSTGTPKGVMIPHLGISNRLSWGKEAYGLSESDRVLQAFSLSFDFAVWEIFTALVSGAQLIIAEPGGNQDSNYLIQLVKQQGITFAGFVPSMLRAILEEREATHCHQLRRVVCGGEVLPVELQEHFFRVWRDAELHNTYGPTEASIDVTCFICSPSSALQVDNERVPIGRPIANTQLYILDSCLNPVPVGVAGELHIAGVALAIGYLNRPDLTAEKFVPNPFSAEPGARMYKTGDLARYRSDGNIEFVGRIDHQVKIRGFRIEPGEIESALRQNPLIRDVVVVACLESTNPASVDVSCENGNVPSADSRDSRMHHSRLSAYVVAHDEQSLTPSDLRGFLHKKIPEYMIPSAFVFVDALPFASNGKLDRNKLPPPAPIRRQLEDSLNTDADETQLNLTKIWEKVLDLRPIGQDENFFELGGHSLLGIQLFAEIEKTTGRRLPLSAIFKAPTIKQLAAILREEEWSTTDSLWSACPSSVVPFQTSGSKPPLFWFNWGPWDFRLPRYLGSDQPVYGLQHQGQNGRPARYTTVECMAAHYIDQVRTVQRNGPYFLGGFCIGGMVVYEMAQQLQEQGERVGLLVMLDPTKPRFGESLSAAKNATKSFSDGIDLRGKIYHHIREIQALGAREKLSYALVRVQDRIMGGQEKVNWLARRFLCQAFGYPLPLSLRAHYIVNIYGRAARNYRPRLYRGRVVLFKTQGRYSDRELLWDSLAIGDLTVRELEADHECIFKEPYISNFANDLNHYLAEAQSR